MNKILNYAHELQNDVKKTYRELCEEWRSIKQLLTEAEAKEAELKQQILASCGGAERMEHGVKVALIETKGTIEYKIIPEVMQLDKNYLDQFRKPTRKDFRVSSY